MMMPGPLVLPVVDASDDEDDEVPLLQLIRPPPRDDEEDEKPVMKLAKRARVTVDVTARAIDLAAVPTPARSSRSGLDRPTRQKPRGTPAPAPPPATPAPAPKLEEPLSREQECLLHKVLVEGQSIFFTGAAGTGKSRTLRELLHRAPEYGTFPTALTGLAATQLPGGTTLHSFTGMGLAKGPKEECLEAVLKSTKAKRNWERVRILVIDEASMMSKALFEKIEFVARHMRRSELPFGGITLCLCGDFFQLPPVARGPAGDDARFCFESEKWSYCFAPRHRVNIPAPVYTPEPQMDNCFELTEVFRQKQGPLLQLLAEVRYNEVSERGLWTLRQLARELVMRDGVEPTRLVPTNSQADQVNRARLLALPGGDGREAAYEASDGFAGGARLTAEAADQQTTFPRRLELRLGAQVMLLFNASKTLVNGSRGVVVGFEPGPGDEPLPVVRFLCGAVETIGREDDKKELAAGGTFTRSQVPLRLSWAITIHKSQGMSIDFLEVDLRSVFEIGQAYVALSRARTLEGLRVISFDVRKFWTSPKVVEFSRTRLQRV